MPVPDFESIMLPVLQFLSDDKSHPLQEVLESTASHFKLTEEELRQRVPSGQQPLFRNRVAWAISYMKNAGLIEYPSRGVYKITGIGKSVVEKTPERINIPYLKTFEAYKSWQKGFSTTADNKPTPEEQTKKTPEEIVGDTVKSMNEKVAFELLELLKTKQPSYFEGFVLKLLHKMGYGGAEENFEVVGKSGDFGIDGIIYQDEFGIDRVYVQAKRWQGKVQSKEIRDFIGSLSLKGTNKGIFITTSDFTDDCHKSVQMNPHNRIILINGKKLTEYALKHNVGIQVKTEYAVKILDNDFFEEL
jgi:restriction system protein